MIYANEIDPVACAVLRECGLMDHVSERSIELVRAEDLGSFRRAHFFAGAGLWEVAARLAGWPADRELWTGSCPCQPLSVAGQRKGHADRRHLWPAFYRLIAERRPATIVGEQVASKDGREWLAGVFADLETLGYACGAADLPACSVGSPQKRNRLWWVAVADANSEPIRMRGSGSVAGPQGEDEGAARQWQWVRTDAQSGNGVESVADADCRRLGECDERQRAISEPHSHDEPSGPMADADGRDASAEWKQRGGQHRLVSEAGSHLGTARDGQRPEGSMVNADCQRFQEQRGTVSIREEQPSVKCAIGGAVDDSSRWRDDRPNERSRIFQQPLESASFWSDAIWLNCADGKARRTKSGLRLLVDGMAGRTDLWRLAGNSIVPQVAAQFLSAVLET